MQKSAITQSSFVSAIKNTSNVEPYHLLNRLLLIPTPSPGSSLEKLLISNLKALIQADFGTENMRNGIFKQPERNYILARSMQILNDKELQNQIRTLGSSQ